MFFNTVLTVALASLTAAGHAPPSYYPPIKQNTFSLAIRVGYGDDAKNLSLAARPAAPASNSLVFVGSGEAPATVGTPIYVNGTSPTASLFAIYTDGQTYGLRAADVGSNYGLVTSVLGTKGDSDPNWYVGNGEVFHKLFAGSNLLMACNATFDGEVKPVLSFGVINSNGSIPYGCQYTRVFQVCNQRGSKATCT